MKTDHLVTMANQIGDFFVAMPDHHEGLNGVVDHIRKFWDPRMRRALQQHLSETQGQGLSAFVREALQTHADLWA